MEIKNEAADTENAAAQDAGAKALTLDEVQEQMRDKYGEYFWFAGTKTYLGELFWSLYKLNPTLRELALISKCVYLRDSYCVHSFCPNPDSPTGYIRPKRFWRDLTWKHPIAYEILMTLPLPLSIAALVVSFLR